MIYRSPDRIQETHEFFTPHDLVVKLNKVLPEMFFKDPTQRFVDGCCGEGNILTNVLRRKIEVGCNPTAALKSTFGVDLMPDNVRECRRQLIDIVGDSDKHWKIVNHNIVCFDMFMWDYKNWKPKVTQEDKNATIFTID